MFPSISFSNITLSKNTLKSYMPILPLRRTNCRRACKRTKRAVQDTTRSFMDGGSGKRDRQKYEIYMEATMLDRIADCNYNSKAALNSMNAEVQSESEKHHVLVKEMKVHQPSHLTIPERMWNSTGRIYQAIASQV